MAAVLQRFTINDLRLTIFKLFLAFSLFSLLFFLFSTNAFAQTPSTSSGQAILPSAISSQSSATNQYQTSDLRYLTSGTSPHTASLAIYNFSHAMSCILIGQSPIAPCLEYKMVKDATGAVRSVPYLSSVNTSNGVLGISLSMIGEVIGNPPIRSSEFIANFGEQIGIKSAHAQVGGSGSGVLAPIFKLWEVSRNISYLAMIIIFIVVGFMVMFRQKLNPQTVVSVQLALPGLVIGLVMITFSYFLASLISDMAFVGTNVVGYYFSLAQGPDASGNPQTPTQLPLKTSIKWGINLGPLGAKDATEANVLTIFARLAGILPSDQIAGVLNRIWVYLDDPSQELISRTPQIDPAEALLNVSRFIIFQLFSPLNSAFPGYGLTIALLMGLGPGSFGPASTIAFILGFLASIILIFSMFKLLLRLIQNLLSIIFLTIASPFYFLATSLPGKQSLLPNWFFNMLCNVLAFPAVFAVFYFVAFILGSGNPDPDLFKVGAGAKITGESTFPLLGGLTSDFLNRLLAFGALIALPSIPDIICRAVGKPGQLGALAAGAVGGAIAAGQRYQGQAGGFLPGIAQNTGRIRGEAGLIRDPATGGWRPPENLEEGIRVGSPGVAGRVYNSSLWRRLNLPRPNTPTAPLRPGAGGGAAAPSADPTAT